MPRPVAENDMPPPPGILARIAAVVYPLGALGLIAGGIAWGWSGPGAVVVAGALLWTDFSLAAVKAATCARLRAGAGEGGSRD